MRSLAPKPRTDSGFTLIEVLMVVALAGTLATFTVGGFNAALQNVRGDASMNIVQWQLKLARETAINQRRSVEVRFTMPNFITVARRNIPSGETVISTAVLEHGTQFYLFPGAPDTPDSFGASAPIDFSGAAVVRFNADGQFTDGSGNIVNGSIFIGNPTARMTARALTVFGPTATIRTYQWTGSAWRH